MIAFSGADTIRDVDKCERERAHVARMLKRAVRRRRQAERLVQKWTQRLEELGRENVMDRQTRLWVEEPEPNGSETTDREHGADDSAERSATALVLSMVNALVDDPGDVSVSSRTDELGTHLAVRVAATDIGKLIGRQGRTARSIRVILSATAMKLGTRFSLDLFEAGRETADV